MIQGAIDVCICVNTCRKVRNLDHMKYFFINIGRKIFIPVITLMITYCVLYQYIANFSYLIVIKLILLILSVFLCIGSILDLSDEYGGENNSQKPVNKIVRNFYLKSYTMIVQVFCCYFTIYMILFLDKKSILFNYLLLFLFGLLIGCRITRKANELFKDTQGK